VPESHLKRNYPKTYAYFRQFEKEIRACALLKQYFNPARDPFYSSYNVGEYTFQQYKVVWKEISPDIQAAVVNDESKAIVPDHKLVMVSFHHAEPAYFLCAILNSSPIRMLVRSYAMQTSISGHVAEYARIPTYSKQNEVHQELAELARKCHEEKSSNGGEALASTETRIDELVADLWDITDSELRTIQDTLPKQ